MPQQDHSQPESPKDLRKEIAEGLLYVHTRLADNTRKTAEVCFVHLRLIELLSEKGLISIEELDQHKRVIAERLAKQNREKGMGVLLQQPEYDKYAYQPVVQIDCAASVHLCHAACCKLPFALSKQDVREGILHWDLGQPYVIAQGRRRVLFAPGGRGSCRCSVWATPSGPLPGFRLPQGQEDLAGF